MIEKAVLAISIVAGVGFLASLPVSDTGSLLLLSAGLFASAAAVRRGLLGDKRE
jgi:hypothetical protein